MRLKWDEELSTGIPQMDEQHRKLIDMLNHFYEAVERGQRDQAIETLLQQAEEYTLYHFNSEEALMREMDYPEFEPHQKAHQNLINEVRSAKERRGRGDEKAVRELAAFLLSWLYTHIAKTDHKYGEFYRTKEKALQQASS